MKLSDGQIHADASVTDLRLYGNDHAKPDAARIRAAAQWIADSRDVILSVGLTRQFRVCDAPVSSLAASQQRASEREPDVAVGVKEK